MKFLRIGLAMALALTVAACQKAAGPGNVDAKRLEAAASNGEWLSYGKDYNEQRFSPLDKINAANVKDLGLAWYAEFDTDRGLEATPLMVDGVLYTTTAWSMVFAFDAKTGKLLWKYDPKVAGQEGLRRLLRRGQPRRRRLEGPGLRRHPRRPAGRARRQGPARSPGRSRPPTPTKPYTITGAPAGHQGQGADRQRRRRVRRARLRLRL